VSYNLGIRSVEKVGIIGSGQIGPDIALHMTKTLSPSGVPIVVVDIAREALDAGRLKLDGKIDKGVESGAFRPEQGAAMKDHVEFTDDYGALAGVDFVVEAATEDLGLKQRIFGQLEGLCSPNAVLASNSSHLEPERIFDGHAARAHALVIHYFFPAERNPLVEVVPSSETDTALVDWLLHFYESIGKIPIRVGSRYGYAIDPIFEGLFQAAALVVEEGLGTTKEVDWIARKSLGLGVGPFTAMNLTGGNPITAHGLDEAHERVHPWFRTPKLMKDALASGAAWDVPSRGERLEVPSERAEQIEARMRGAYFGLVNEVLSSGIANVSDLELGVEAGLVIRPAFSFMNDIGVASSLKAVRAYRDVEPTFPIGDALVRQEASGEPWDVAYVLRRDVDGVAVLTIRRPLVLNALNDAVFEQIRAHLEDLAKDDSIRGVVLTGFGRKAFVSGADVSMLAKIQSAEQGEQTSRGSHSVLDVIEAFPKPIVCAYNGLAFGGGNEIGMACHARVARKGLSPLAAQPEPNLGIIPGAGATQRLPRLIGVANAWGLLRTGRPVSSERAVELGLIREEIDEDVVAAAVALAKDAGSGAVTLPRIPVGPIDVPDDLPDVALGHLSVAVDGILQKAILEGARMTLEAGLRFESKCFGEICALEDMRIGVENFMNNGPRAKASFVNR